MKVNYSEIRTILEDNGYEPDSIIDVTVVDDNKFIVKIIEVSIVKYVTIRDRNCESWEMHKIG